MSQWTIPDDPNPTAILREARTDIRRGRYELAASKHAWFHRRALDFDPKMAVVRLGSALEDWERIGQRHPPAFALMRNVRDDEDAAFRESAFDRYDFHSIVALNRTLHENHRTNETFRFVASVNADSAQRIYHIAERYLVVEREFQICGQFLQPSARVSLAREFYGACPTYCAKDLSYLIALLVHNGRKNEAEQTQLDFNSIFGDDPEYRTMVANALKGSFPRASA